MQSSLMISTLIRFLSYLDNKRMVHFASCRPNSRRQVNISKRVRILNTIMQCILSYMKTIITRIRNSWKLRRVKLLSWKINQICFVKVVISLSKIMRSNHVTQVKNKNPANNGVQQKMSITWMVLKIKTKKKKSPAGTAGAAAKSHQLLKSQILKSLMITKI